MNICEHCGNINESRMWACQSCRDRSRARQKALRARRRAAGTCALCEAHPLPGLSLCDYHHARQAEYTRRFQESLKEDRAKA